MSENEARDQKARDREDELRRIPLTQIDPTKWPKGVRVISMGETG